MKTENTLSRNPLCLLMISTRWQLIHLDGQLSPAVAEMIKHLAVVTNLFAEAVSNNFSPYVVYVDDEVTPLFSIAIVKHEAVSRVPFS